MRECDGFDNSGGDDRKILQFRQRPSTKQETPHLPDKNLIRRRMAPALHEMADSLAQVIAVMNSKPGSSHPGHSPDSKLESGSPLPELPLVADEVAAQRAERALKRLDQSVKNLGKAHGKPVQNSPDEPLLPFIEDE